jgi:hypothetical protein
MNAYFTGNSWNLAEEKPEKVDAKSSKPETQKKGAILGMLVASSRFR